jgi:hypothetical protein
MLPGPLIFLLLVYLLAALDPTAARAAEGGGYARLVDIKAAARYIWTAAALALRRSC